MPVAISGSGRCGTSMVAGLLAQAGLYMGTPADGIEYADSRNPRGYWEHGGFVDLNLRLLAHLAKLYPPAPELVTPGWEMDPSLGPFYDEAGKLAAAMASDGREWGWKFTQSAVILPFWRRVVPNLKFVLCVRNPLDFISSLREYGGFDDQGPMIWLYNNLRLLMDSTPAERTITFFEDYFPDVRNGLYPLLDVLGVERPPDGSAAAERIRRFHACSLKHHGSSVAELLSDARIPYLVKALYVEMLTGGRDGSSIPILANSDLIMPLVAKVRADAYERADLSDRLSDMTSRYWRVDSRLSDIEARFTHQEQILASTTHRLASKACDVLVKLSSLGPRFAARQSASTHVFGLPWKRQPASGSESAGTASAT